MSQPIWVPTLNSCTSLLLPPLMTTSSLCISHAITSSFLYVHICIQPHDPFHSFSRLLRGPCISHYYPDWSSLLMLAQNVAARLSLSAPVLLLLCDVNEAFWFVIKRWPRDTERLINQDKSAGEG